MDYDVDFFFLFFKYMCVFNISLLINGLTFIYLKNSFIILVLLVMIMNFISYVDFCLCCNFFQSKNCGSFERLKGWICLFCNGSSLLFSLKICSYVNIPKSLILNFIFSLFCRCLTPGDPGIVLSFDGRVSLIFIFILIYVHSYVIIFFTRYSLSPSPDHKYRRRSVSRSLSRSRSR